MGKLADKNTYFTLMRINCKWLKMYGSAPFLHCVSWNKSLYFSYKQWSKWNPCKSSWYCYSAASYLACRVSSYLRYSKHPSHLRRFRGNGLRMYEGITVILDYHRCDLSKLKWVSILPYQSVIDRTWFCFCDYFNLDTKFTLDYLFIIEPEYDDFDVFIRATRIVFYDGELDYYDLAQVFSQNQYAFCILWKTTIQTVNVDQEWTLPSDTHPFDECTFILYGVSGVSEILEWPYLFGYVSNITYVRQHRLVEPDDIYFLCQLILAPKSKLHQLHIFFWDKNAMWSHTDDGRSVGLKTNPDLLMEMFRENLQAIKKNHWDEIKCGLLMQDYDKEHVIDISKLSTKLDITRAGAEWKQVLEQMFDDIQDDTVESFPVRDMWKRSAAKWLNPP